jgi:hypothetical protein
MIAAIYAGWRRKPAPVPEQGERATRPMEGLSDAALQQRALSVASDREATITEALFRTRDALLLSQSTTNDLTESVRSLTRWLVLLTVVIVILTVVMAGPVIVAAWHWWSPPPRTTSAPGDPL